VVALDSDVSEPQRSYPEIAVAIVVAILLVLGVFVLGRAISDDDSTPSVAATGDGSSRAAAATSGDAATAAATGTPHAHDAAGAGVDDRGFSKLENGDQHAHSFTQAISKADRAELARQLTLARETALKYPTVKDAEAAGLRRAGPFSPGLGAHYISYSNALGNADGAMSDDDIRKPLAWIYDGTKPDSRIAGLFYMSGNSNPAGFAGPNDTWHVHHDICIKAAGNGVVDAPLGADHDATKAQCDAVGGNLLKQTQYLLHAWVVPGYESPEGVFSHLSSTITCDDGTYNTIADVTKVGSSTTMCLDGTE
jgi:hypothetical protein